VLELFQFVVDREIFEGLYVFCPRDALQRKSEYKNESINVGVTRLKLKEG